ncbi:MAG TPA: PIN domain-containing protein [Solirubrobacteraceae bacterium]
MGRGTATDAPRASEEAPLKAFLDTNVLVRHLTGDPPEMAKRATATLAADGQLLLTDLVLAECVYVLESFYEVGRSRAAELMRAAIALPSVAVLDARLLLRSLEVYEIDRLDFAEAYLIACAEATGVAAVLSFDRTIDRIKTVKRIES